MKKIYSFLICLIGIVYTQLYSQTNSFVHPGLLVTQKSFDRIKLKVNANEQPWLAGWEKLTANSHAQTTYTPNPVVKLIRGGNSTEEPESDNYSTAFNDAAAAFQCAVRWKVTGDSAYAEKSIQILNAWASTCTSLSGNSNIVLGAGIYGYQFANAAEIMRDYQGWSTADFTAFKQWMVALFLPVSQQFLADHRNTCISHYWANWDLVSLANIIAISVLTDNYSEYDSALEYLKTGAGNGNLNKAIYYIHPDGLGQLQESGRDQGHSLLCVGFLAEIAEIAWNQGDDLYGYNDNRIFKGAEYAAKYNIANLEVPFEPYNNCDNVNHTVVSNVARGNDRPIWVLPYMHYIRRKGLTSEYLKLAGETLPVEGGGGDYGPNSGGYDSLGFGTLLYTEEIVPEGKHTFEFDYPSDFNYWVGLHGSTNVIEDGKLKVTFDPSQFNGTNKRRADLKYIEGGNFPSNSPTGKWKYSSEYPILAYKISFTGTGKVAPGVGNIKLDRFNDINNSYATDYVSENIIYYDVSTIFSESQELPGWQLKIADITSTEETGYEIDWIRTFKTVNELEEFLEVQVFDFENSNAENYWVGLHGATNVIEDGKLKVTFNSSQFEGSNKRRADLKYVEGAVFPADNPTGTWKYYASHPILAYKISFNGTGSVSPGVGNIKLDRFDNLNNSFETDYVSDNVIYYDISTLFTENQELPGWQLKIADITSNETGYEVDWIRTFTSVAKLEDYIGSNSSLLAIDKLSSTYLDKDNSLFIYPNPSTNHEFYLNVNNNVGTKKLTLKVYSVYGALVLQKHINIHSNTVVVNHNLAPGVYYVDIDGQQFKLVVCN